MPFKTQNHAAFLKYMHVCNPNQRKLLLRASTDDEVRAFCTMLYNICKSNKQCGNPLHGRQKTVLTRLFTTKSIPRRRTQLIRHLQSVVTPYLEGSEI